MTERSMPGKTDSEVEQWVLRELRLSANACSREICVLARDGVVRLRGSAQSYQDKSAIEEATGRATGVVSVLNEIRVKPCTALLKRIPTTAPLTAVFRPDVLAPRIAAQNAFAKAATRGNGAPAGGRA